MKKFEAVPKAVKVAAPPAKVPKVKKVKAPPKKIFVAMAGNIGAGKTTAAKMVSQKFGFELFDEPVIDNRFLKNYYADMKRWSFTLQLEFLIQRVQHHELIHQVPKSCIQDRTLYEDPEIFAKYLHGLGNMTDGELELYFDYFKRLTLDLAQPDKVICFDVPKVDVLLSRIKTRGRGGRKRRVRVHESSPLERAAVRGVGQVHLTWVAAGVIGGAGVLVAKVPDHVTHFVRGHGPRAAHRDGELIAAPTTALSGGVQDHERMGPAWHQVV